MSLILNTILAFLRLKFLKTLLTCAHKI